MSNHNMFVEKNTAQNYFLKCVNKLENSLKEIKLAVNHNGTYLQKDSYQLLANLLIPENNWERMLYSELNQMCFQLEIKCHGSSIHFIKAFSIFAKEIMKQENPTYRELVEDNQVESTKYLNNITKECVPAIQRDIEKMVHNIAQDPVISTTVLEAVKLAGIEGNIVVSEGNVPNIVVELQFGYNFPVQPFKGFVPSMSTWTRNNVKVLLVDGMIEKVSEIDKLLMKSYESKIPLLLIAQGFSEEVIATIWNNNQRGTFDVMPLRLQQSLEALNVLNDISAVSGGDVLSTLKGEMLVYVDYDSLPLVEHASITEQVLTLQNSGTRNRVLSHLNYLNNRRTEQQQNTSITDLADLTTKRIQNLLAHTVKITIPKGKTEKMKAAIDNTIRVCRSLYTYGFCEPSKVSTENLNGLWKKVHEELNVEEKVPSISLYLALNFAANLAAGYFTSSGTLLKI